MDSALLDLSPSFMEDHRVLNEDPCSVAVTRYVKSRLSIVEDEEENEGPSGDAGARARSHP